MSEMTTARLKELRRYADDSWGLGLPYVTAIREAVAEIDRLRAKVEDLESEVRRQEAMTYAEYERGFANGVEAEVDTP